MKKIALLSTLFFSVLLLSLSSFSGSQQTTGKGIDFFNGPWKEALTKAKKENKLIFLDANASWCRPCKLMEKNTFTDPFVGEFYNKHFVNVKMDMEKGEGIAIGKKLQIQAYPTLFFVDGDGNIVQKKVGYLDATDFLALGKEVVAKK